MEVQRTGNISLPRKDSRRVAATGKSLEVLVTIICGALRLLSKDQVFFSFQRLIHTTFYGNRPVFYPDALPIAIGVFSYAKAPLSSIDDKHFPAALYP
nr:hypothetical protein [Niabella drilacis]